MKKKDQISQLKAEIEHLEANNIALYEGALTHVRLAMERTRALLPDGLKVNNVQLAAYLFDEPELLASLLVDDARLLPWSLKTPARINQYNDQPLPNREHDEPRCNSNNPLLKFANEVKKGESTGEEVERLATKHAQAVKKILNDAGVRIYAATYLEISELTKGLLLTSKAKP